MQLNQRMRDVRVGFVGGNTCTRWGCNLCGGRGEKSFVTAEVLDGLHKGFRVCWHCLDAGDIDARLEACAAGLEAQSRPGEAAYLRDLIGRLAVPTVEDLIAEEP